MESLTNKEREMLDRLKSEDKISWAYTCGSETQCLNRLVKKGYAVYKKPGNNVIKSYWVPFNPNDCQCSDEQGRPLNQCDECPR